MSTSRSKTALHRFPIPNLSVAVGLAAPVLTAAVGLWLADALVTALGDQFQSLYPSSEVYHTSDRTNFLDVQVSLGVLFVTDFITLLVVGMIWALVGGLPTETRRWTMRLAWSLGCVFGLGILLRDMVPGSKPMWAAMASSLFEHTVLKSLNFSAFPEYLKRENLLNLCIRLSNIVFIFGAAFVVAAVSGVHREFRNAVLGIVIEKATLDRVVALTIGFVYRLQIMLLLAAVVMVSGLGNMVAWRFWPLAYLPKGGSAEDIRTQYQGLAEGSIILQGALFTLILLAVFLPPVVVLNNLMNANPALFERIRKDKSVSGFLSFARSAILHASPLGAAIAAAWIGR